METIVYLCIVTFLAGLIQGFSGFGSVLLSLPLLALFMDVKTAIPLMTLAGLALTISLLFSLWKDLEWRKVFPLLMGAVCGVPVGVFLLTRLDARLILLVLGGLLLVYGLYGLVFRPRQRAFRPFWAYFYGFLAGCLGGGFSASGPPVIVYTSLQPWSKDQIKVTLQGFFVTSGAVVLAFQAAGGLMTALVLRYFAISFLPLMAGTYVGHFFYGRIPETAYRKAMLALLALLGAFTIWKAW